jgi:hypothetical protein
MSTLRDVDGIGPADLVAPAALAARLTRFFGLSFLDRGEEDAARLGRARRGKA